MSAAPKILPLDPPATEAEHERASALWTAAMDVMVARGYARLLWGCQGMPARELVILVLRGVDAESFMGLKGAV